MTADRSDADTTFTTLASGVRVVCVEMPHLHTACVSVFVRSGSAHESRPLAGIGHIVEHMVFKGTRSRDARRINLDAERLGADVNAHTDKDHTAFHMRGLAPHAPQFVAMLADLVQHATFPADELERERGVLLHEHTETEDDPMGTAYRLFDHASYGLHAVARPVIGSRASIERLRCADLADWVRRQYTADNVIVAAAGAVDPQAIADAAQAAFAGMPRGPVNALTAPDWIGGIRSRRVTGSSQTHLVMGFPLSGLAQGDPRGELAATLLGEGMSSPLMDELRERRGLVYYAACAADQIEVCGEFVVEASFAPDKLDEVVREISRLLRAQADAIDPVDLERAHNQVAVRWLRAAEKPTRRLEAAALDLFAFGHVRPAAQRLAQVQALTSEQLRAFFAQLLTAPPSVAVAGSVGRALSERAQAALAPLRRP